MNHVKNIYATCLTVALTCSLSAQTAGYCDNFEAPTLNPFWTATSSSGSIALSSAQVHGGSQAVQFNSVNTGANKHMNLEHVFAQPTYGRLSVWVYDTGATASSSNYIGMWTGQVGIFTFDYNLGPTNGGNYTYNLPGGATIHSNIPRTQAWHEFVIDTTPTSLTLAIDGTTIYSAAGNNPLTNVRLYMGGPSWRPAWTSYFDDFCFNAPPPPTTSYCDNFEAPTLNPFWTATSSSGSIALSSAQVHGGSQAVQFNSVNTGADKHMTLEHVFAQPTYGRLSVWVYDTGATASSSNYIGMWTGQIGIFTFDYNLGPTNGGNYTFNLPGGTTTHSSIPRTQAWHEFVIDTTPTSLTLAIDGTTIYSAAGNNPLTNVRLYMGGPSWRPAWTSYFDDFCFTGSYELFGSGCAGSNGTPTLGAPASGPYIGSSFDMTVSSLPLYSAPIGMIGTSNTFLGGGGALPLPLDFLGMPGCTLFVSPDSMEFLGNRPTPNTALWRLTIPSDSALVGLDFYQQVLVLEPGINPFNGVVSNAGHGTIR